MKILLSPTWPQDGVEQANKILRKVGSPVVYSWECPTCLKDSNVRGEQCATCKKEQIEYTAARVKKFGKGKKGKARTAIGGWKH